MVKWGCLVWSGLVWFGLVWFGNLALANPKKYKPDSKVTMHNNLVHFENVKVPISFYLHQAKRPQQYSTTIPRLIHHYPSIFLNLMFCPKIAMGASRFPALSLSKLGL